MKAHTISAIQSLQKTLKQCQIEFSNIHTAESAEWNESFAGKEPTPESAAYKDQILDLNNIRCTLLEILEDLDDIQNQQQDIDALKDNK